MKFWNNKKLDEIIKESYNRDQDAIYPCSMNFPLWHSGIHIETKKSNLKNIIGNGKIIASNINSNYINKTQSDSFILVEHKIKINKEDKTFYVLYSNLQPFYAYLFEKKDDNSKINKIKLSEKENYIFPFNDLPFYCSSRLSNITTHNTIKYIEKGAYEGNSVLVKDFNLIDQIIDIMQLPKRYECTVLNNGKKISLSKNNLEFDNNSKPQIQIKANTPFYSSDESTIMGKLKEGYYDVVNTYSDNYVKIKINGTNVLDYINSGVINFPETKENIYYRKATKNIYACLRKSDYTEDAGVLKQFLKRYHPLSEIKQYTSSYKQIIKNDNIIHLKTDYFLGLNQSFNITKIQYDKLKKDYSDLCSFINYNGNYFVSFTKIATKISNYNFDDIAYDNICIYSQSRNFLPFEKYGNDSGENKLNLSIIYFTLVNTVKKVKYVGLYETDFLYVKKYIKARKIVEMIGETPSDYHFFINNCYNTDSVFGYSLKIKETGYMTDDLSHLKTGHLYLSEGTTITVSVPRSSITDFKVIAKIKNAPNSIVGVPLRRNDEIVDVLNNSKSLDFNENILNYFSNKKTKLSCTINKEVYDILLDDINDADLEIINNNISKDENLLNGTNIGIGNTRDNRNYVDIALFTKIKESNFIWEKEYIPKGTKLYKTKTNLLKKTLYIPKKMLIKRQNETINGIDVVKIKPSVLRLLVYSECIDEKRIEEIKNSKTKTKPLKSNKNNELYVYVGKKGFLYKNKKVTVCQNDTKEDIEVIRKLIEDYINSEQEYISCDYSNYYGYYFLFIDCSKLDFDNDYYLINATKVDDENENVYLFNENKVSNEKEELRIEFALKDSYEVEISDEIIETDQDYYAKKNNSEILITKLQIPYYSINVNSLGDFYVPITTILLKTDFLQWNTFKEIKNKCKEKLEFDIKTVEQDLKTNIDFKKIAQELKEPYVTEPKYNLFLKWLSYNVEPNIFEKEETGDYLKDSANKLLNAFYNGKFIHSLECDKSLYTENIRKLIYASEDDYQIQADSMNMFEKMKSSLGENNNFAFYNPICFLDKLDKAGLFEFNPYTNYSGEIPYDMKNNPGFMPERGFSFSQPFNKPYASGYWHEGVDLAIDRENCGDIGIISGISGKVIFDDDKHNYSYGCFIVVQANELYEGKCRYYLLAHLDRTKPHKKTGDDVFPNDIVGYIGNTGHCGTIHLTAFDGNIEGSQNAEYRSFRLCCRSRYINSSVNAAHA